VPHAIPSSPVCLFEGPKGVDIIFISVKIGVISRVFESASPEYGDLAGALSDLVRGHQFDRLISLTREALKEKGHE
jgi:hypothetical protein